MDQRGASGLVGVVSSAWYDAPGFQLSSPVGRRVEHVSFPSGLALGFDWGMPAGPLHCPPPYRRFVVTLSGGPKRCSPAGFLCHLFGLLRHLMDQSYQPRLLEGRLALHESKHGG